MSCMFSYDCPICAITPLASAFVQAAKSVEIARVSARAAVSPVVYRSKTIADLNIVLKSATIEFTFTRRSPLMESARFLSSRHSPGTCYHPMCRLVLQELLSDPAYSIRAGQSKAEDAHAFKCVSQSACCTDLLQGSHHESSNTL